MAQIKIKKKPCKGTCGLDQYIFSKGLCRSCYLKQNTPTIKKISDKQKIKNEEKKQDQKKMQELFVKLWDKTEDAKGYCYCYETQQPMHRSIYRNNSICYHHVLEKGIERYKKYTMEEFNIVIVLPDIHSQVHRDIDKTPRIKILTQELQEKY